jgi:hypothetical protein
VVAFAFSETSCRIASISDPGHCQSVMLYTAPVPNCLFTWNFSLMSEFLRNQDLEVITAAGLLVENAGSISTLSIQQCSTSLPMVKRSSPVEMESPAKAPSMAFSRSFILVAARLLVSLPARASGRHRAHRTQAGLRA